MTCHVCSILPGSYRNQPVCWCYLSAAAVREHIGHVALQFPNQFITVIVMLLHPPHNSFLVSLLSLCNSPTRWYNAALYFSHSGTPVHNLNSNVQFPWPAQHLPMYSVNAGPCVSAARSYMDSSTLCHEKGETGGCISTFPQ